MEVTRVLEGSPAEIAGIKAGDIITHIDQNSLLTVTQEKAMEGMRGAPNTKVVLTISRTGESAPFDLSLTRQIIQMQSTQNGPQQ